MTKILIADDHAVVRRGIREILTGQFAKTTFTEVENAQETLDQVTKHDWSLVILDISMPDRSGMDVLKELKSTRPNLPVLMLSMHPEEQFARRALRAGAAAYMTKESVPDELVRAVQKVLAGGRYVSASLAEKLAWDVVGKKTDAPLHEILSDREFQILRMIAAGKAVKTIADELGLSVKTVSTYRARILEKTGMKSNADIIRYGIENRLAEA